VAGLNSRGAVRQKLQNGAIGRSRGFSSSEKKIRKRERNKRAGTRKSLVESTKISTKGSPLDVFPE